MTTPTSTADRDRTAATRPSTLRITAVQATPVWLDRTATLAVAVEQIRVAAAAGTDLVVFPESFVPGYPDWVWRTRPWDDGAWFDRFADQAVDLSTDVLDVVCEAAATAGVWVALGITERDGTALHNTVVYVDRSGTVVDRHRKLVVTGAERLVWTNGDDHLLTVVEIDGLRVGSLVCWELYMPLARTAMYERGVDVLLSPTWDNSDEWVPTLRHVAKEGSVYVVSVTAHLLGNHVSRDHDGAEALYGGEDDAMSRGNSTIVAPGGAIVAGPLSGEAGHVTAVIDPVAVAAARRRFDPVGHYGRADVLSLTVSA